LKNNSNNLIKTFILFLHFQGINPVAEAALRGQHHLSEVREAMAALLVADLAEGLQEVEVPAADGDVFFI